MSESLLPAEDSRGSWGMFGYRAACCDMAIKGDNAAMLSECIDRGFVGPDDEMLSFKTVRQYCKDVAPRCHEMLQARSPA